MIRDEVIEQQVKEVLEVYKNKTLYKELVTKKHPLEASLFSFIHSLGYEIIIKAKEIAPIGFYHIDMYFPNEQEVKYAYVFIKIKLSKIAKVYSLVESYSEDIDLLDDVTDETFVKLEELRNRGTELINKVGNYLEEEGYVRFHDPGIELDLSNPTLPPISKLYEEDEISLYTLFFDDPFGYFEREYETQDWDVSDDEYKLLI